jgi:hypothetical protein
MADFPTPQETIDGLRSLDPNWDSYGGLPPTEEAIKAAHTIVGPYPTPWHIAPTGDGGIIIYYQQRRVSDVPRLGPKRRYQKRKSNVKEIEIWIAPDGTLSYLVDLMVETHAMTEGDIPDFRAFVDFMQKELGGEDW